LTIVITILYKVLVREYYRQNIAFFLLIIAITCGFMSGVEHRALAEFFISTTATTLIPVSISIVYLVKVLNYNLKSARLPQNEIILNVALLAPAQQFIAMLATLSMQMLPALIYSVFLFIVAIQYQAFSAIITLLGGLTIMLTAGTYFLIMTFRRIETEKKISVLKKWMDNVFTRPLILFYIEWIFRRALLPFLGTKVFSCLVLTGVAALYQYDQYDNRLMAMGVWIAFISNITLIASIHDFENRSLSVLRNLPMTNLKRVSVFIGTLILLALPEMITLFRVFPESLTVVEYIMMITLGAGISTITYGRCYAGITTERLTGWITGLIIGGVLLILSNVPLIVLALAGFGCGYWWFVRYYDEFEAAPEV